MKHPKRFPAYLIAGALLLSALLPLPASGAHRSGAGLRDPNDTQGRLDLRSVAALRMTVGGVKGVSYRLNTFSPWKKDLLWGKKELDVLIDTNEDGVTDYSGTIFEGGTHLYIDVFSETEFWIQEFPAHHPHGTTAAIFVPDSKNYEWNPKTEFQVSFASRFARHKGVCKKACVDHAPDSGWITVQAAS